MACNKRMIDIEREIDDFFSADEFKKLAFSYDGVYRDYCNPEKFQIYDDTPIEPICRGVNEKIREIIDNATINMFIRNNGIYMESDFPFGRKRDIQIGKLIITKCGCGGQKDNWIIRFDNEYVYHTFQFRDEEEISHYRVLDVKEKIPNMIKALKGVSARLLMKEFREELEKKLWMGHLWNPSYFVATVSENTEEQIRQYIQNQKIK